MSDTIDKIASVIVAHLTCVRHNTLVDLLNGNSCMLFVFQFLAKHTLCKTKLYINAIINVSSAKNNRTKRVEFQKQNDKNYPQITVA